METIRVIYYCILKCQNQTCVTSFLTDPHVSFIAGYQTPSNGERRRFWASNDVRRKHAWSQRKLPTLWLFGTSSCRWEAQGEGRGSRRRGRRGRRGPWWTLMTNFQISHLFLNETKINKLHNFYLFIVFIRCKIENWQSLNCPTTAWFSKALALMCGWPSGFLSQVFG